MQVAANPAGCLDILGTVPVTSGKGVGGSVIVLQIVNINGSSPFAGFGANFHPQAKRADLAGLGVTVTQCGPHVIFPCVAGLQCGAVAVKVDVVTCNSTP